MSENWPWNSLKMTNESKSFVDNQFFSPLPWKWKGNTNKAAAKIPPKKQLQFLIKTERFAATKLKDHFTTNTFTLFHLIYYKNPPHSFWFVISSLTRRCPVVERWLLSTKVPLTITLQQSSFPCGTEGWEFAPAALKGSVMRCALRWEETWWEPLPIPICWLYWSSLRPYVSPPTQRQEALQILAMFLSTLMTSAFTQSCVIFIWCHVFFSPSKAVGA